MLLTSADNVTLLAFVAEHRAAAAPAINRYSFLAGPTAANPLQRHAAVIGATNRRTDRWTGTLPLHRPCSILCSVKNRWQNKNEKIET